MNSEKEPSLAKSILSDPDEAAALEARIGKIPPLSNAQLGIVSDDKAAQEMRRRTEIAERNVQLAACRT